MSSLEPAQDRLSASLADASQRSAGTLASAVLDSTVVGVLEFDAELRLVYANTYAQQMLADGGMPISGLKLSDFYPHILEVDGTAARWEDYQGVRCLQTGQPQGPKTVGYSRPNGEVVWTTVSSIPVFDPDTGRVKSTVSTFVDISRYWQVEETLRQSEERYRRLVENAPDAIVVHHDNKIVYINEAGVRLWGGKRREDFLGKTVIDLVHPRYREEARKRIAGVQAGTTAPLADQRHVRLDGTSVRVEVTGIPCVYDGKQCVQTILRDVTKRRRAERQVRRQRELLRKFFDRIPLLVGMFDAQGRAQLCNREWRRVLGWGPEYTLDQVLDRCYPHPAARRKAEQYTQRSSPGWIDARVTVRDGRVLDISCAMIVLSDGTRISIGQDITERKEAEAALRRYQLELEERVQARTEELVRKNLELEAEITVRRNAESQLQEKQQTLQQMLDVHERYRQLVAYEIHDTFVQEVIGALMYLDLYRDKRDDAADTELVAKAEELLREAVQSARRMISGLRPPIIDEQGIVAAIEYLVSEQNAQGMEIQLEHDLSIDRLAPVIESTVFRIVQETLTNVQRHSNSKFAQVDLLQVGNVLTLRVRDFGVGFDPEKVGAGHFGLRGVKERARLLHGTVHVHSRRGQGTEIVVEVPLPAADDPTANEAGGAAPSDGAGS